MFYYKKVGRFCDLGQSVALQSEWTHFSPIPHKSLGMPMCKGIERWGPLDYIPHGFPTDSPPRTSEDGLIPVKLDTSKGGMYGGYVGNLETGSPRWNPCK